MKLNFVLLLLLFNLPLFDSYFESQQYHCVENNRTSYIISSANYCVPNYDIGSSGDSYYFGPCENITYCLFVQNKCMFANGRDKYCISRDIHLCPLVDKGNFTNYFVVECG